MKSDEIRAMELDDIQGKVLEFKALLTKLRFSHAITPIENPKRLNMLKKDIARLKTELRLRELKGTLSE